ncbi:MAG: topoisomerase DNA-binding C4 zinc finger domain-containing protein [Candidatus Aenigmatarchaeota archaeon]|nr:topoisomerase DNA-binding C4 zinc finger domain-containing protein [Candidatus Aenigmarchaeota archaeon]
MDICVHCGKFATMYNSSEQPVCKNCFEKKPKHYSCKKCGAMMVVKKGKYGSFWGCIGYPLCDNTVSLKEAFLKTIKK